MRFLDIPVLGNLDNWLRITVSGVHARLCALVVHVTMIQMQVLLWFLDENHTSTLTSYKNTKVLGVS